MAAPTGPRAPGAGGTPKYRVVMSYDRERETFVARVPELEHCQGEGATRTEALAAIEQEIEAQIGNIVQGGGRVPGSIDDDPPEDLPLKIGRTLGRELLWAARNEGITPDQLASELISQALEARRHGAREARLPPGQAGQNQGPRDGRRDNRRDNRDRRGISGSRYHAVMEDRANFIEYVRSLESNDRGPRRR